MRLLITALVAALLATAALAAPPDATVPEYHGGPDRGGHAVVPGLTVRSAAATRLDANFDGRVPGHIYAQPLYWRPPGSAHGLVIVATEANVVAALDAVSGRGVWQRSLGSPIPRSALECGNIDPVGITGTPAIDPATGTVYLDAVLDQGGGPRHMLFALGLADGTVRPGWPIAVGAALAARGLDFPDRVQQQRGALTMLGGRLYVPYGGYTGDCGPYHGWVLGVDTARPGVAGAWETRAGKGGIWAPGGVVSDGRSILFATGNTEGAQVWGDGEAIFRLDPDLRPPASPARFFAAANWRALDATDADLGGTAPTLVDPPGGAHLLLGLGKDGHAYLLDRDRLGGIGHALRNQAVASGPIRSATATFTLGRAAIVVVQARAEGCPGGGGLLALRLTARPVPALARAWCAALDGAGAPIVTTSTATADPIVWVLGAGGDERLHAYRGDGGAPLYTSEKLPGLRRFATILAAEGRLYIPGDDRISSFILAGR
jgi:hypothetical protein